MAISGGWIFGNGLKLVHGLLPHLVEMRAQAGNAFRGEAIVTAGSRFAIENQAGILEHAQVLGDGRAADRKGAGQLIHREGTGGKLLEDGHAGGISDGVESGL
jgi:hypothetical protein